MRLISWVKSRCLPNGVTPRVIRGGVLRGVKMHLDFAHQTQLWLGWQERELARWLRQLAAGIESAVDVGAAYGMYTLYFLAKTSARRVIAFEPDPGQRVWLQRNVALNALPTARRLEIVPRFVGAETRGGSVTLDEWLPSFISPCLVKIDIDGGEVALLGGAERCLRLPDVRWIIEVHSRALERQCLEILRAAGYQTQVVPNAWWRIMVPELRPGELNRWIVASRQRSRDGR